MSIKIKTLFSFLLAVCFAHSQQVSAVYKIGDLLKRMHNTSDTVYVLNFWATWCVPCVKELPALDSFALEHKNEKIKVLMVSLDFKEDIDRKVNAYLKKNGYKMECVLLDEINGNDFIDKINPRWTGSIPATLMTTWDDHRKEAFIEKKVFKAHLDMMLKNLKQ